MRQTGISRGLSITGHDLQGQHVINWECEDDHGHMLPEQPPH